MNLRDTTTVERFNMDGSPIAEPEAEPAAEPAP